MNCRLLFLFLLGTSFGASTAQNLVINPSFEETKPGALIGPCTFLQYSTFFDETLKGWKTYTYMTPDVLTPVENCPWLTKAYAGERCIGIINYLPASDNGDRTDYHEWVQGSLRKPLVPGERYVVECWVMEDSAIVVEHLKQVYMGKTPVVPVKAGNLGFYFYFNHPFENKKPQVNFAKPIETNGAWVKLSAEFVAEEPYDGFILGNFFSDQKTPNTLSPEQHRQVELKNGKISSKLDKIKRAAYLCIDNVSVELAAARKTVSKALTEDRKFTFNASMLFDFNKSELKPEAAPLLDSLAQFLKDRPTLKIGIAGHTDNVGTDEYNLELSQHRAESVLNYLVEKGIAVERLKAKGFGESKPVADNLTEAGRQANRRVECVILKSD